MKLSFSLLILSTVAEGFITQPECSPNGKARCGPLCAIDLSTIDQIAQIDLSGIQSQISTALPDLPQVIESGGVMMQVERLSTALANNAAVVNGGIGVGSFLLGSAVTGKGNAEGIEGLEKSVTDKESALQELRSKLEEAQTSENELNIKITQYEDEMFDSETKFEMETDNIRREFQTTLEREKDKMRKKTKTEMKFTMDLKMNKERSMMLQEKLEYVKDMSLDKNIELSKLRLKNVEMQQKQKTTDASLQQSQDELENLMAMKNEKAFWPKEIFGLRLAQAESGKEIERLTKELEEMDIALVEAKEEIETVDLKKIFQNQGKK